MEEFDISVIVEDDTHEFKREFSSAPDALKDLAAFHNSIGGTLILGVDKDKHVHGTDTTDDHYLALTNRIDDCLPPLTAYYRQVLIQDVQCIVIEVQEGTSLIKYNKEFYGRFGSQSRPMKPEQVQKAAINKAHKRWDSMPSRLTIDDLSGFTFEGFKDIAERQARRELTRMGNIDILQHFSLVERGLITNAGVLFFSHRPVSFFQSASVQVVRIGRDNDTISFNSIFDGCLLSQLEESFEAIYSLLEQDFQSASDVSAEGGLLKRGVSRWEYPQPAVFEALVNAITHRDYSANGGTMVRINPRELEIRSPGLLVDGLSISSLKGNHGTKPRNILIADVFRGLGIVERAGTGIDRMMRSCASSELNEPEFLEDESDFSTVLRKDHLSMTRLARLGLSDPQIQFLRRLRMIGEGGVIEYRDISGLPQGRAQQEIDELLQEGWLERTAPEWLGILRLGRRAQE